MAKSRSWPLRLTTLIEIFLGLGILTDRVTMILLAAIPGLANPLASVPSLAAWTTVASVLLMMVLVGLLKLRGLRIGKFLWGDPERVWQEVKVGFLTLPGVFGLVIAFKLGFRYFWPTLYSGGDNILEQLMQGPGDLLLFLFVAFFTGGLKEEFQRAFLIRRFEAGWGPACIGVILMAIPFGLAHRIQGTDEAVIAGLLGSGWGLLYLRRRSLIAPMVSHALYDALELCRYYNYGPMSLF